MAGVADGDRGEYRYDEYRYAPDAGRYRRASHGWLAELDRLAVHEGLPHQRMGTRAIDEDGWFLLDEHGPEELALRSRLLVERPDDVFACLPGAEAACAETLEVVGGWLRDRGHDLSDHPHPLAAAGLSVQDDLCVMERDAAGWRFTAGMLCFPSYWKLHEKLGHTQEVVHGPVPHFATDLAARMNLFFDRLVPGRIVSRRNWGFSRVPLLFAPDVSVPEPPGAGVGVERLWVRSERQTLRRLPRSGAVLFGIRVQLAPIAALAAYPDVCGRLAAAIDGWSPELLESRGGRHGDVPAVSGWLRAAAGRTTTVRHTAQPPEPFES